MNPPLYVPWTNKGGHVEAGLPYLPGVDGLNAAKLNFERPTTVGPNPTFKTVFEKACLLGGTALHAPGG